MIGLVRTTRSSRTWRARSPTCSSNRSCAPIASASPASAWAAAITFLTACLNSAVKAAVPFYGGGIGSVMQPGERTPKAPLEYADKLAAPLLLFFGENDSVHPARRSRTHQDPSGGAEEERRDRRLSRRAARFLLRTSATPIAPTRPRTRGTRLLKFFNEHLKA